MKGWRPECWKNPFDEEIESMEAECRKRGIDPTWHGEAGVGQKAYEAGADALIKALCTDENRLDCIDQFVKKRLHKWGWLVYIPDRKEGE